jgi:hypothetical protein
MWLFAALGSVLVKAVAPFFAVRSILSEEKRHVLLRNPYELLQSKEMQPDALATLISNTSPHGPGFLPFFTTDETQCHHYGGRIVSPKTYLGLLGSANDVPVCFGSGSLTNGIQHSLDTCRWLKGHSLPSFFS